MKNIGRNLFFWLIAGTLLFMMLDNYSTARVDEQLTYSEFKQEIQSTDITLDLERSAKKDSWLQIKGLNG